MVDILSECIEKAFVGTTIPSKINTYSNEIII